MQWLACWTLWWDLPLGAGETLEICGGYGLRVLSGLAVVGKGEGLSAPIGARACFSPWIYALLPSNLTSRNFLSLTECRRLEARSEPVACFWRFASLSTAQGSHRRDNFRKIAS